MQRGDIIRYFDMTIREKVLCANNDDELKNIDTIDGRFE